MIYTRVLGPNTIQYNTKPYKMEGIAHLSVSSLQFSARLLCLQSFRWGLARIQAGGVQRWIHHDPAGQLWQCHRSAVLVCLFHELLHPVWKAAPLLTLCHCSLEHDQSNGGGSLQVVQKVDQHPNASLPPHRTGGSRTVGVVHAWPATRSIHLDIYGHFILFYTFISVTWHLDIKIQ